MLLHVAAVHSFSLLYSILPSYKYITTSFFSIYLFIYYLSWLHRVLVAAHGIFVVACGLLSCGRQTLSCGMHAGSSSPTRDQTCAPLHWECRVLSTDHQGSPRHNFFTHSPFERQLGCFLFQGIMNNKVAMNILVHAFEGHKHSFMSDIYQDTQNFDATTL